MDERVKEQLLEALPRLRRYCCGLTGSVDEGDDLAQATCERAIRYIGRWQPDTRLDAWMFRMARNLFLNGIRDRRTRAGHLRSIAHSVAGSLDGVRAAEAHLSLAAVRDFITRLPEEQRSVLLMVCVEGMSYEEVARTLDLPVGTVTSRLGRGRLALKTWLDGQRPAADVSQRG